MLGIQEFVNELNHHLFLEGENVAGQFLQKYLWNIYKFECEKYQRKKIINAMKITEEYLLGDGYDKDVIVYRYNELDEKITWNKNQHGEKVASYIYLRMIT